MENNSVNDENKDSNTADSAEGEKRELKPDGFTEILERKNPLRTVINYALLIFFILFFLYVLVNVALVSLQYNRENLQNLRFAEVVNGKLEHISEQIENISLTAWAFFQPFLQLVLLFFIIDWVLNRFGIDVFSKTRKFEWNVQVIIALIIVSAFAAAALTGLSGVDSLKDLTLVVVGFYFGSQRKITEIETPEGKMKVTEQHDGSTKVDDKENSVEKAKAPEIEPKEEK